MKEVSMSKRRAAGTSAAQEHQAELVNGAPNLSTVAADSTRPVRVYADGAYHHLDGAHLPAVPFFYVVNDCHGLPVLRRHL